LSGNRPAGNLALWGENDEGTELRSDDAKPTRDSPMPSWQYTSFSGSFLEIAVAFTIVAVLAAQLSDLSQYPMREFDLDTFLALKGILDVPSASSSGDSPSLLLSDPIVGALFGQPQ
jgi:hypothetical protein